MDQTADGHYSVFAYLPDPVWRYTVLTDTPTDDPDFVLTSGVAFSIVRHDRKKGATLIRLDDKDKREFWIDSGILINDHRISGNMMKSGDRMKLNCDWGQFQAGQLGTLISFRANGTAEVLFDSAPSLYYYPKSVFLKKKSKRRFPLTIYSLEIQYVFWRTLDYTK